MNQQSPLGFPNPLQFKKGAWWIVDMKIGKELGPFYRKWDAKKEYRRIYSFMNLGSKPDDMATRPDPIAIPPTENNV